MRGLCPSLRREYVTIWSLVMDVLSHFSDFVEKERVGTGYFRVSTLSLLVKLMLKINFRISLIFRQSLDDKLYERDVQKALQLSMQSRRPSSQEPKEKNRKTHHLREQEQSEGLSL